MLSFTARFLSLPLSSSHSEDRHFGTTLCPSINHFIVLPFSFYCVYITSIKAPTTTIQQQQLRAPASKGGGLSIV